MCGRERGEKERSVCERERGRERGVRERERRRERAQTSLADSCSESSLFFFRINFGRLFLLFEVSFHCKTPESRGHQKRVDGQNGTCC